MSYQGTDRQSELKTLYDELAYTEKRLGQANAEEDYKAISKCAMQIRKNILHYGGKI